MGRRGAAHLCLRERALPSRGESQRRAPARLLAGRDGETEAGARGGGTRVLRNIAQRALSVRGHRPDRGEAPRAERRGGRRPRADREDDPRLRLLSAPVVEDLEEGAAAEFLERQSGGERLL